MKYNDQYPHDVWVPIKTRWYHIRRGGRFVFVHHLRPWGRGLGNIPQELISVLGFIKENVAAGEAVWQNFSEMDGAFEVNIVTFKHPETAIQFKLTYGEYVG